MIKENEYGILSREQNINIRQIIDIIDHNINIDMNSNVNQDPIQTYNRQIIINSYNNINNEQQSINFNKPISNTLAQQCEINYENQFNYNDIEERNNINQLIILQNQDHNFAICDDQININHISINLQIKQTFNILRQTIQKLLNQQELSLSILKFLPKQLQDDFNDFISYIKQKINQIKNQNNLTFIVAQIGNQPQIDDLSGEIYNFISLADQEYSRYQKIIEQRDKDIAIKYCKYDLTKLNEQQILQEQAQKLHVQQYSVLKNEIKNLKQNMNRQIAYFESLKNIFKKMMLFWIEDEDNYDDFEDNIRILDNIIVEDYLNKYRLIKNIQ